MLPIVERHYPHTASLHLSENVLHFQNKTFFPQSSWNITYSFHASVGCRDSGSVGFLISPSVSHLFEALSEGQNQIHPNEKAIVDLFLHLVPPYSFSPRKHLSFFVLPGLMRLSGHTCALRKIPLLSLKLYYSAQGHNSQCF